MNWAKRAFTQAIAKRWLTWLDKRIPANATHQLTMQSIFVLPTVFGWGFLITAIGLFLLGTNYQNNLMLLLSYTLMSLQLLALFHSYLNFARLTFKVGKISHICANEILMVPFSVVSRDRQAKAKPAGLLQFSWLIYQQSPQQKTVPTTTTPRVQSNTSGSNQEINTCPSVTTLDLDKDPHEFSVPLRFIQRGRYALPRLTCESVYPLGLFRCWTHLDFAQHLLVYPAPIKGCVDTVAFGNEYSRHIATTGSEDFFALNAYKEGDPLNRVSWKHVAKNGQWVSKEFSNQQGIAQLLTLDPTLKLEKALSHLSYHIYSLHQQQQSYGLKLANTTIAPGNSSKHKKQCLKALALYPKDST